MKIFSSFKKATLVLLMLAVPYEAMPESEGLNAGQIKGFRGKTIKFTIANSIKKSGDVVFIVEHKGAYMCETITHIDPYSKYQISMPCPTYSGGNFFLIFDWAEKLPKFAPIARRL